MDHSKEIKFNYYNILAIPINNNIYSYVGKPNQPNLLFIDNGNKNSFVSQKIFIKNGINKELIIENHSITNFNKPIFLHFPLVTNPTTQPNVIDMLIKQEKEVEINLNSLLNDDDNCKISESNEKIDLYFQTPILIQSDLSSKNVIEGLENKFVITNESGESVNHTITGTQDMDCQEITVDNNPYKTYITDSKTQNMFNGVFYGMLGAIAFLVLIIMYYLVLVKNYLFDSFKNNDDEKLLKTAKIVQFLDTLIILILIILVAVFGNIGNKEVALFFGISIIFFIGIGLYFKVLAPNFLNISPQPESTKIIFGSYLYYTFFWNLIDFFFN